MRNSMYSCHVVVYVDSLKSDSLESSYIKVVQRLPARLLSIDRKPDFKSVSEVLFSRCSAIVHPLM